MYNKKPTVCYKKMRNNPAGCSSYRSFLGECCLIFLEICKCIVFKFCTFFAIFKVLLVANKLLSKIFFCLFLLRYTVLER